MELSRDRSNKCSVCKTALSNQWAFDESFKVVKLNDCVQVTQGEPEAPHGVCFKLSQTNSAVGPVRHLAETCYYQFGEKHGVEIVNHSDSTIEYNWGNGKLHGRCAIRDANDNVLFECNHIAGKKHGRCVTYSTELGKSMPTLVENYVDGALHGLQLFYALDKIDGCTVLQKQLTYENGVLHGPVFEWSVSEKTGESAILYGAQFINGFRHGRFVSQKTIHRECTVTEEFWSDGTQELRHGLHRIESQGKIYLQAQYVKGKLHGRYFERSTFSGQLQKVLNFNHGKLHGECSLHDYNVALYQNVLKAYGKFNNGVAVGYHILYDIGWDSKLNYHVHAIKEIVNYDSNGQLHGTCTFNNSDCMKSQVLNFKHGVLHGRQIVFACSEEPRVAFHMKDGVLHGNVETTDARGEMYHTYVTSDDEITLRDVLGERALRYPALRFGEGIIASRYMSGNGDIHICEWKALGIRRRCNCDECYTHEDMENDYDEYENDSDIDDEHRERHQEEMEWLDWNRQQRYW